MAENRPSKKQRELLVFIEGFIKTNGYGPSYREVMGALDYKSVSTVATHINGLILRGLLRKKDNSARSLEVVSEQSEAIVGNPHIQWLRREIKKRQTGDDQKSKNETIVLQQALEILDQTDGKKV